MSSVTVLETCESYVISGGCSLVLLIQAMLQEKRKLSAPKAGEVTVAVHSTGLCGSDGEIEDEHG